MDLSIVILNYNTSKLLRNCLNSVLAHTKGIKFEILAVDNASSDDSVKTLMQFKKSKHQELKIIKNPENLGFAAGNNSGLKQAQGDYVLLLNTDTILKENAFKRMVEFARKHPRAGVVGPRLLNQDSSDQPSAAPFFTLFKALLWLFTGDRLLYSSPSKETQVDWVMGSVFLIKKEMIKKIGLLDEKFFMYLEEQEYCFRIKKAGWQVWFYPGARVYHLVRGSSPEGKQKAIWWIYQSLVYFYQKHFAAWQSAVIKCFLRLKAGLAWLLGYLTKNENLKKTYGQAFKMV